MFEILQYKFEYLKNWHPVIQLNTNEPAYDDVFKRDIPRSDLRDGKKQK